jgi:hypothetical protein
VGTRYEIAEVDGISWPVLGIHCVSLKDFVRFWEQLYSGYDEDFYQENIGQPLTEKRIAGWFEWKNRTRLSARKMKSIRRYLSPEEHIDHNANVDTLSTFLTRPGGVIWRIFWLHLQHPLHFPIYDQHVHRAMAFMLKWRDREIPAHNRAKVRVYLGDYRAFFARFGDCDHRQVDRALWSFGRFLRTEYARIFTSATSDESCDWIEDKGMRVRQNQGEQR